MRLPVQGARQSDSGRIVYRRDVRTVALLAGVLVAAGSWSVVASPNEFAGANELNAVAAISATDAWAVGFACCGSRHAGDGTLTEHWDGARWEVVPSPDSLFNDDLLVG